VAYQSLWSQLEELIAARRRDRVLSAVNIGRVVKDLENLALHVVAVRQGKTGGSGLTGIGAAILPLIDPEQRTSNGKSNTARERLQP
jgi:hypothetical protein